MKKIVLVQDHLADNRLVARLVELFAVQCGQVNIEVFYPPLILAQDPDLVIFDVATASESWVWRLEQLKRLSDEWGVRSPITIVLSSHPSDDMERQVRMARADLFLPKNLEDGSLELALNQVLSC